MQTHMSDFCRVTFALVTKTQIYHVFIPFYRVQMQNIECIRRTQASPPHTMTKSHRIRYFTLSGTKNFQTGFSAILQQLLAYVVILLEECCLQQGAATANVAFRGLVCCLQQRLRLPLADPAIVTVLPLAEPAVAFSKFYCL